MAFWHRNQRFNAYRLEEIDDEALDGLIEYFDAMMIQSMDFDEEWTKRLKWAKFLKSNPELMQVMASVLIPKRRYWWNG